MKIIKIDRNKWYRGKSSKHSKMLMQDGRYCCLGGAALSCGVDKNALVYQHSPANAYEKNKELSRSSVGFPSELLWLLNNHKLDSQICYDLMDANDNEGITDKKRETFIRKTFKENGLKVQFIN